MPLGALNRLCVVLGEDFSFAGVAVINRAVYTRPGFTSWCWVTVIYWVRVVSQLTQNPVLSHTVLATFAFLRIQCPGFQYQAQVYPV